MAQPMRGLPFPNGGPLPSVVNRDRGAFCLPSDIAKLHLAMQYLTFILTSRAPPAQIPFRTYPPPHRHRHHPAPIAASAVLWTLDRW